MQQLSHIFMQAVRTSRRRQLNKLWLARLWLIRISRFLVLGLLALLLLVGRLLLFLLGFLQQPLLLLVLLKVQQVPGPVLNVAPQALHRTHIWMCMVMMTVTHC